MCHYKKRTVKPDPSFRVNLPGIFRGLVRYTAPRSANERPHSFVFSANYTIGVCLFVSFEAVKDDLCHHLEILSAAANLQPWSPPPPRHPPARPKRLGPSWSQLTQMQRPARAAVEWISDGLPFTEVFSVAWLPTKMQTTTYRFSDPVKTQLSQSLFFKLFYQQPSDI